MIHLPSIHLFIFDARKAILWAAVLGFLLGGSDAIAELRMPAVFSDSMVLQRDAPIHLWGWTTPGTEVTITLAGQSVKTTATETGRFDAQLPAQQAGGPHQLTVKAEQLITFDDVLIGEVWVCSGQSNMRMTVGKSFDADLESLAANYPKIRLLRMPNRSAQLPKDDFSGQWTACNPATAAGFSAVGYFFGRQLHQTLGVPIGLIDNSWGGSAAEAWLPTETLANDGRFGELLNTWEEIIKTYNHDDEMAKWQLAVAEWKADGKPGRCPRKPDNKLKGNQRPANLYNGCLHPILGYSIRGVAWYQGESNTARAYQYRDLFPLLIKTWREKWRQGDFPFYWVQLADFRSESDGTKSSQWAELREAQTMTQGKLPNTGQAVIIDLGETTDIHPRNKQDVAKRLARWALANDYGYDNVVFQSPIYRSMKIEGGVAKVTFDHVGDGLMAYDSWDVRGFSIAGDDQTFVKAQAEIKGKSTIEVWADSVSQPVAVRYAWADNPAANVESKSGLPLTPFRTDNWPGVTIDRKTP